MTVVSLTGYVPPSRFDGLPWVQARLEQAATQGGSYTTTETFDLDQDPDPAHPATRSFTSELGTVNLWYRIVWVDEDGDESSPTAAGQNVSGVVTPALDASVQAAELATILQVNATSNSAALNRVIDAAYGEIVAETGRTDFVGWEIKLVEQVTLARAEELWRQMKAPWGVIDGSLEFGGTRIATDTFARHAKQLAPLKRWEGIA